MKSLVYRPPANANGIFFSWLNELRALCGVYVIRNAASAEVLYVGESHTGRLADTIKRHFYKWRDEPERQHYTYQKGRVEIAVRITPPLGAMGAQYNLIQRLQPRDNTNCKDCDPF